MPIRWQMVPPLPEEMDCFQIYPMETYGRYGMAIQILFHGIQAAIMLLQ